MQESNSGGQPPTPGSTNFEKYHSGNPIIRWVTNRFLRKICALVRQECPSGRIVDLGCGEGMVYAALVNADMQPDYCGVDLSSEAIAYARATHPEAQWMEGDVLTLPPTPDPPELILCLEVIEHIPDSTAAFRAISTWNANTTILSVPWEPWFRLGNLVRGARWATLGNHPEHVQHFSPRSFRRKAAEHFSLVAVQTCFPWIIAVCHKPRRSG